MKQKISPFILTLHRLLSEQSYPDILNWDGQGETFTVNSTSAFGQTILPKHFRNNSTGSFFRQLNLYGFTRVNDGKSPNPDGNIDSWCQFKNPHFKVNSEDTLSKIKRLRYPKGRSKSKKKQPKQEAVQDSVFSCNSSPSILHVSPSNDYEPLCYLYNYDYSIPFPLINTIPYNSNSLNFYSVDYIPNDIIPTDTFSFDTYFSSF
ncbi:winged helix DNA-binding domain-containing protein [Neoconidiobolus thromboides FSU 785]|nr:winged helix DNA-binding domain-containing protein [Neoconidiobolus thromboides FSU 785]